MAKLSISGMSSFEGNAARKLPPRQVEQDDEEPITQRLPNASAEEAEPITQRRGKKLSPKELEHELGIEREERDLAEDEEEPITQRMPKRAAKAAEEEDLAHVAKIQKMIDDTQASERLRPKMKAAREKLGLKPIEQSANAYSIEPPPEVMELGPQFEEAMRLRKTASIEEARQLVKHGDRLWELVDKTIAEHMKDGNAAQVGLLSLDMANNPAMFGKKYDLATDYVRTVAMYRRAAEAKDPEAKHRALVQLERATQDLGLLPSAEIQQHLEREDAEDLNRRIQEAREATAKLESEASRAEAAKTLTELSREFPSSMSVDRVKKYNLVKRPADLWDNVRGMVPTDELATEYVLALGRVNEASRTVNLEAYDEAKDVLDRMSGALGIQNRADILSETLPRPGEKYENPFGA